MRLSEGEGSVIARTSNSQKDASSQKLLTPSYEPRAVLNSCGLSICIWWIARVLKSRRSASACAGVNSGRIKKVVSILASQKSVVHVPTIRGFRLEFSTALLGDKWATHHRIDARLSLLLD